MKVDICLPIRNEASILENNLNMLLEYCAGAGLSFSWRIVGIVNDSSDDSVKILNNFKNRFPDKIDYLEISRPGKGLAIKTYWAASEADILCCMDCDLVVSLKDLPALIAPIINNEAELTVGSRFSTGSRVRRSLFRELVSISYIVLSRMILNHKISDLQCGFKAIRRESYKTTEPHLRDDFWFFDTELILLVLRFGGRVREIPVDWSENRFKQRPSAVKVFNDSLEFIKNLLAFKKRLKLIK